MPAIFESPIIEWINDLNLGENWTLGAPLPIPLFEAAAVTIDNRLYAFGGFTMRLVASNKVYLYRPEHDQWSEVAQMPMALTHMNVVVDGQYMWFAGGFIGDNPGPATNHVWKFDTKTCTWEESIPLPENRAGGALQICNDELHYYGGFDGDRYPRDITCDDHWSLNLKQPQKWIKRAPMPESKGHHSSVVFGNRLYAVGGQIRHDTNPQDLASVYAYDPQLDQWEVLPELPEPRSHAESSTFIYNDKLIIIGGNSNQKLRLVSRPLCQLNQKPIFDGIIYQLYLLLALRKKYTSITPNISAYDFKRGVWEALPSLPFHLIGAIANVVDEKLIVAAGSRRSVMHPQCRTLLNETLLDVIKAPNFNMDEV